MAPTGSSMPRRSQKNTDKHTSTPAISPMTTADHAVTKAQGAVMATSPASMPFADIDGSNLPNFHFINRMAASAPPAEASMVFVAMTPMRKLPAPTAPSVEPGLNPNRAKRQDKRADNGHRNVVARQSHRLAFFGEFSQPRSQRHRARKPDKTADGIGHARAGKVYRAVAQFRELAQHGKAAAAPYQMAVNGIGNDRDEEPVDHERREAPPLGHRPGGNRRGGIHEHHLKQEQRINSNIIHAVSQEKAFRAEQAEPGYRKLIPVERAAPAQLAGPPILLAATLPNIRANPAIQ